jgi:hypothetical protein
VGARDAIIFEIGTIFLKREDGRGGAFSEITVDVTAVIPGSFEAQLELFDVRASGALLENHGGFLQALIAAASASIRARSKPFGACRPCVTHRSSIVNHASSMYRSSHAYVIVVLSIHGIAHHEPRW